MPNLLVLGAEVELRSAGVVRRVPVDQFVTGNRATLRRPDELVTALLIPNMPEGSRGLFRKLGARRYLVISIAMVAALIVPARDGTVASARVAVGACGPVARRLPVLEDALAGLPLGAALAEVLDPAHLAPLSPIDDMRATAAYRLEAALTLLRRTLAELGEGMA